MTIIEAIILGIIQGLTEFIPISSTAHLTIAGKLMNLIDPSQPERWTAFIAVIQLGTLSAVLAYFAKDLNKLIKSFLKENYGSQKAPFTRQSPSSKLGWYIIIATIPIVTVGLAAKKLIEGNLTKDPYLIACSMIGLALVLLLAEIVSKRSKEIASATWLDALVVGFAQCLALIPGSSRSGTTITAGLFMGLKRSDAAKFSFLLSIPAVLASGLLEFYQSLKYLTLQDGLTLALATIVAAVSGYASIAFLLAYLKKRSTALFIVYRIIFGIMIFLLV